MKNILTFIDTWGVRTLIVLTLLTYFRSCKTNNMLNRANKDIKITNQKVDSLFSTISKDIKIEGLKVEKRMIQSTDRKMMDVNRQSEIDKELKTLQGD